MVLRRTQVARPVLLLAALAALAACSSDPALVTTGADVERARLAWQDPWAAPDNATVPTNAYGTDGQVRRSAGTRTTSYDVPSRSAVRLEVAAATGAGWRFLGAACSAEEGTVRAVVVRGSSVDDGMWAEVVAEDEDGHSALTVTTLVPHHADHSWPDPREREAQGSCLSGGGDGGELPALERTGPPLSPVEDDGPDEAAEWRRTSPDADAERLVRELEADRWFASTGAAVNEVRLDEGDSRRFAPTASGEGTAPGSDPRTALRDAVADMDHWRVTWVRCGPGLPAEATLVREFDAGTVVARVLAQPTEEEVEVTWRVVLPIVEAPATQPHVQPLEDSACLSTRRPDPGITLEGVPAALPHVLQPVAD